MCKDRSRFIVKKCVNNNLKKSRLLQKYLKNR